MTIREICARHGLQLERGSRVLCEGRPGTIVGASGPLLRVKFDGKQISSRCDPLDVQVLGAGVPDVSGGAARGSAASA